MDILTFMGDHPFLTFFLAVIVLASLCEIIKVAAATIRNKPIIVREERDDEDEED